MISAAISLYISAFFTVLLSSIHCQYLSFLFLQSEKTSIWLELQKPETISYCENIFPLLGTIKENIYTEYR